MESEGNSIRISTLISSFSPLAGIRFVESLFFLALNLGYFARFSPLAGIRFVESGCRSSLRKALEGFSPLAGIRFVERRTEQWTEDC